MKSNGIILTFIVIFICIMVMFQIISVPNRNEEKINDNNNKCSKKEIYYLNYNMTKLELVNFFSLSNQSYLKILNNFNDSYSIIQDQINISRYYIKTTNGEIIVYYKNNNITNIYYSGKILKYYNMSISKQYNQDEIIISIFKMININNNMNYSIVHSNDGNVNNIDLFIEIYGRKIFPPLITASFYDSASIHFSDDIESYIYSIRIFPMYKYNNQIAINYTEIYDNGVNNIISYLNSDMNVGCNEYNITINDEYIYQLIDSLCLKIFATDIDVEFYIDIFTSNIVAYYH